MESSDRNLRHSESQFKGDGLIKQWRWWFQGYRKRLFRPTPGALLDGVKPCEQLNRPTRVGHMNRGEKLRRRRHGRSCFLPCRGFNSGSFFGQARKISAPRAALQASVSHSNHNHTNRQSDWANESAGRGGERYFNLWPPTYTAWIARALRMSSSGFLSNTMRSPALPLASVPS